MKTIQEQLCDRVYELLPEKKELEFGCLAIECGEEFDPKSRIKIILSTRETGIGTIVELYKPPLNNNTGLVYYKDKDSLKIIGQPLRLADLLLAINRKRGQPFYQVGAITKAGTLILGDSSYKLQDDNILNQSDELCKWALEILK